MPGGYWVAAANPHAAHEALVGSEPISTLTGAALLSDGASRIVDRFGLATWADLVEVLDREGPKSLIEHVREAERSDVEGSRWPRGKGLDDATAAWCRF